MRRRAGGFTLLEILLALMLTGLVLVSLNTFIFSMGELWGRGGDARLLDRHVQAFTRFLEEDLRGAEPGTVAVREMRTAPGGREWVVSYLRPEGNRVMVWPERPLPDVLAGLGLRDGQGLWLLWHSVWEERFLADPARETQLSPWVTTMAYDYFDEQSRRWETRPDLRRLSASEYETPRRLRLTFAYRHLTRESVILLPTTPPGPPTY